MIVNVQWGVQIKVIGGKPAIGARLQHAGISANCVSKTFRAADGTHTRQRDTSELGVHAL
jgi:hypothetical protein